MDDMLQPLHPITTDAAAAVRGNADTLRLMRVRRGLTMQQLATSMGKQAPWVSKIEKRQLRLSPDDLARFAVALGVPVELLGEDIRTADSEGTHFRSLKLPTKARELAEAEANFRAHLVSKLLEVADQQTGHTLPSIDVRALREGPERAARYLRELWNIDGPVSQLVPLAEHSGMFITTSPDAVSPKVRGLTVHENGSTPHSLLNRNAPMDAQRHTIAHEIAHLVMDQASGPASDQDIEDRADRFAGELLAPYEMIRPALRHVTTSDMRQLFELQSQWGVHPRALVLRARRHGDIDKDTATGLYRLLNSRHKRVLTAMPSPFPVELKAADDLLALLRSVGWAESHMATLLHVNIGEAADIFDGWVRVFDSSRGLAPVRPLALAQA